MLTTDYIIECYKKIDRQADFSVFINQDSGNCCGLSAIYQAEKGLIDLEKYVDDGLNIDMNIEQYAIDKFGESFSKGFMEGFDDFGNGNSQFYNIIINYYKRSEWEKGYILGYDTLKTIFGRMDYE